MSKQKSMGKKAPEYSEVHFHGMISLDSPLRKDDSDPLSPEYTEDGKVKTRSGEIGDIGISIDWAGVIHICVNGRSFVRAKPLTFYDKSNPRDYRPRVKQD